jgi:hypothetical protein
LSAVNLSDVTEALTDLVPFFGGMEIDDKAGTGTGTGNGAAAGTSAGMGMGAGAGSGPASPSVLGR